MKINNSNRNTNSSQAINRVAPLKRIIIEKIDNNQSIKRLCRYMDKTPLLNKGISYDNSIKKAILHKDLTTTLTENTDEGKRVLYDGFFEEDIPHSENVSIYVRPFDIGITGEVNNYNFLIDVIVCQDYNKLSDKYSERILEIAKYICDELDEYVLDDEDFEDEIGNVVFKIKGFVSMNRLTKNNSHIILTLPVKVKGIGVFDL